MINKDTIIQELYSFSNDDEGKSAACYYMYDDFPIIIRHFDIINEILDELDLTKVNGQILFTLVVFVSPYINQLSNYKVFYQKIIVEAKRRNYSEKKIVDLFEQYAEGGNWLYNSNDIKQKSADEHFQEMLIEKIDWAKNYGDKDLLTCLLSYKDILYEKDVKVKKYNSMCKLLGDGEIQRRSVDALRALADKIESSGNHFIIYADIPKVPIFSDKDEICSNIEISVIKHPMGG